MLNRRQDLTPIVSHAFVRHIDAHRIDLASGQVDKIEDITHHRLHVGTEATLLMDVSLRIVLEKDAPRPVHRVLMFGRELERVISSPQRAKRRQGEQYCQDKSG
jgi:hypothetical protein